MKSKYYRLDFEFSPLASYQRDCLSNLVDWFNGVVFGECSLCVRWIPSKRVAKKLQSQIEDYLNYCHIMHYVDLSVDC